MAVFIMLLPLVRAEAAEGDQIISKEYLADMAKAYVEQRIAEENPEGDFSVERTALPNRVVIPQGNVAYEMELPYGVRYNAPTNVYISIKVDGRLMHKTLVRLRVHQYKEVVVLNRAIPAKTTIGIGDVRLERMDVTRLGAGYMTDPQRAVGMEVKRVLPAGSVLRTTMIRKPTIIERMAPVKILSRLNGAEIVVDGQAMQDGREGEVIRVKNLVTKKVITARIVDASTVEVLTR